MSPLSQAFVLRPARETDSSTIKRIVYSTRLNPTGLDWRRFILACAPDEGGAVIGCAQVKPHTDGTRELASLAVVPAWRGRGVAAALIQYHLQVERSRPGPGRVYLVCRSTLGPFYEKFGFRSLSAAGMTPYFRKYYRLAVFLQKLTRAPYGMLVMMQDL